MKKVLTVLSIALVMQLAAPPARAVDTYLFNGIASTAGPIVESVPSVVQVGGDQFCELKIDSVAGSAAVVSVYSAVELDTSGALKNPALWFRATNPGNGDPDNHLGGPCPNFVGGQITDFTAGTITVKLRSKK